MSARKLIQKRDENIGKILTELVALQESIPQMIEEIKRWPVILKGPIEDEAYQRLASILMNGIQRSWENIREAHIQSFQANQKIQEIIAKAYE